MMIRTYLAAQYARRDELREYVATLANIGIEVTSRWLDEKGSLDGNMDDKNEEFYIETSNIDIADIDRADMMIFFAEDPTVGIKRGGRHVEFGYAWAMHKPIAIIGPKENVFHYLEGVEHFDSLEEFINEWNKNFAGISGE
jgi:nucleoside 2-deoxyribosyltransferase